MDAHPQVRVVTISASYGAGGSIIGPKVAEELDLPFLDRAIPTRVADALSVPLDDVLSRDDRVQSRFWEALAFAGAVGAPTDMTGSGVVDIGGNDRFHVQTEQVIKQAAATTGGVFLGRAAAIVLGARADTLRVRVDGPKERRIAQALALSSEDEASVRRHQRDLDRAWDGYVRRFYRADPTNPRYYDLVLDSTAMSLDTCAAVIVTAARAGVNR